MARYAIFAQSLTGYIGRKGNHPLLWRLKGDLPRFKRLTHRHAIIMGRHTFESLPGLLPDRFHIVVSTTLPVCTKHEDSVAVVDSVKNAFNLATELGFTEQFVIGGGHLLDTAIPYCHHVYRTLVYERGSPVDEMSYVQLPGPAPHWGRFDLVSVENHREDDYDFETYTQLNPLDPTKE